MQAMKVVYIFIFFNITVDIHELQSGETMKDETPKHLRVISTRYYIKFVNFGQLVIGTCCLHPNFSRF